MSLYSKIHEIARENIREQCRRDYNESYNEVPTPSELENAMRDASVKKKITQEHISLILESFNDFSVIGKTCFIFKLFWKNKALFITMSCGYLGLYYLLDILLPKLLEQLFA